MAKGFLEVFPDLHMTTEMEELLKLVDVERVSSTRDRSSIRIYIVSQRLIHKKNTVCPVSILHRSCFRYIRTVFLWN